MLKKEKETAQNRPDSSALFYFPPTGSRKEINSLCQRPLSYCVACFKSSSSSLKMAANMPHYSSHFDFVQLGSTFPSLHFSSIDWSIDYLSACLSVFTPFSLGYEAWKPELWGGGLEWHLWQLNWRSFQDISLLVSQSSTSTWAANSSIHPPIRAINDSLSRKRSSSSSFQRFN